MRPLSGRASIVCWETRDETAERSTSTSGISAWTSTASVRPPTAITKSRVVCWLIATSTFLRVWGANPCRSTVASYTPGGIRATR